MDLVAVDRFESALREVRLGCGRVQIKLANAARRKTIKHLPDHAASDAAAAMRLRNDDGSDQGDDRVRLRACASDDGATIARHDECFPMILESRGRKLVADQEMLDDRHVGSGSTA